MLGSRVCRAFNVHSNSACNGFYKSLNTGFCCQSLWPVFSITSIAIFRNFLAGIFSKEVVFHFLVCGGKGRWWPRKVLETYRGVRDANGEGRELVSKDLRRDLDAVQSEIRVGYDAGYWKADMVCQLKVIGRPLQSAN